MSKSLFKLFSITLVLALMMSMLSVVRSAEAAPEFFDNPSTTVFINEIHYDNAGTDTGEAVEIAGPAGTDLTGWSVVLYNGNGGAGYDTTALSGVIADQGGGYGTVVVNYAVNGIQNGAPDGIALVNASNTVVQFLSYEGSFIGVGGPADGLTSTDIGISEGSGTPIGDSLQLTGSGSSYGAFTWTAATNTFGSLNTGQTFETPSPFVNEIHYDNTGGDVDEAIEVAGVAGLDLAGWSLVLYNGNGGALYSTINLSGIIPDQQNGYGTLYFAQAGIQNGSPDGLALVDAGGTAIQFLSYEGSFVAVGGPADGMTSEDIGVAEASSSAVGDSLQLTGTGTTYADFSWAGSSPNTFGAVNTGQVFGTGPVITPIYDIQFTTEPSGDSPYKNQSVTTQGVVTATFGDNVFIQDGTGPWNGLMLYRSNGAMILGDLVQVEGTVSEYFGLTEIAYGTATVMSSGNSLPASEALATGDIAQEQWESVLVRANLADVANPDLGFGEWSVNNCSGDVRVDDMGGYSYTPVQGEMLSYVQGPLYYGFGDFKIEPRNNSDIGSPTSFTPIYTIQGSGFSSPLDGTVAAAEGVVTADFQRSDQLRGFYLQDPTGDGDTSTSDGIFVYAPDYYGFDVSVGDFIRLQASVDEYFGLTELTNVDALQSCGTGSVTPTEISLPVTSIDDLEAYEGMLVTFPQALVISEYFNFDRYGEIVLTSERHLTPTAEFEPGPDAIAAADAFLLDSITLDDGRTSQNPDPAIHPNGGVFDLSNLFRGGDTVQNLTGVLDYNFGVYKVQPTQGADYTSVNPRPVSPDPVGGNLKVASFNVLNYFTTLDNGGCPYSGGCRGADNATELTRQRDKIIAAISAINADVVGLLEIENNPSDVSTADLVSGLNDAMGAGTYAYVSTGAIGTDAIKVALIYKPASVDLIGNYAILDSSVDPRFIDTKNRPTLAQTFMDKSTGGVFTVAVNHLKSKGSDCVDVGDPDTGDGAGNCNLTRKAAAEAMVDWLATDPTNSGDGDFLIIGDLNSYDKEDPIDTLIAGGYSDQVFKYLGENAYSYVFDGQLGYLDHALANSDLAEEISGVTIWHINADEPDLIDYDTSFKQAAQDAIYAPDAYRSSDHDPVIVGLNLTTTAEIQEIKDDVQSLLDDGVLNDGQANALASKLDNVLAKLAKGNTNAAANQLGAFINQVEDFVSEDILTAEQGELLIKAASLLVGVLS